MNLAQTYKCPPIMLRKYQFQVGDRVRIMTVNELLATKDPCYVRVDTALPALQIVVDGQVVDGYPNLMETEVGNMIITVEMTPIPEDGYTIAYVKFSSDQEEYQWTIAAQMVELVERGR